MYKARKIQGPTGVRGYLQVHGVDYTETFAPVSRLFTFRTLCQKQLADSSFERGHSLVKPQDKPGRRFRGAARMNRVAGR